MACGDWFRSPLRGGSVHFEGCSQAWLDRNVRLKPENSSDLVRAVPGIGMNIDGVYFRPGASGSGTVIKVPDNCDLVITCQDDGKVFYHSCCSGFDHLIWEPEEIPAGTSIPKKWGWPPNDTVAEWSRWD